MSDTTVQESEVSKTTEELQTESTKNVVETEQTESDDELDQTFEKPGDIKDLETLLDTFENPTVIDSGDDKTGNGMTNMNRDDLQNLLEKLKSMPREMLLKELQNLGSLEGLNTSMTKVSDDNRKKTIQEIKSDYKAKMKALKLSRSGKRAQDAFTKKMENIQTEKTE